MVFEGIVDAFLADDDLGAWLRANVELMGVPFVDYASGAVVTPEKCRAFGRDIALALRVLLDGR